MQCPDCGNLRRAGECEREHYIEQEESMIGSHTRAGDYQFQRQASRYSGEFNKTAPIYPVWHDWFAAVATLAFMAIIIILSLAW